uniref:Uncharacterized protein n=1 Tax=Arundo donax TaxID=35708 RepID=A0A0A8Z225_ARUDO
MVLAGDPEIQTRVLRN